MNDRSALCQVDATADRLRCGAISADRSRDHHPRSLRSSHARWRIGDIGGYVGGTTVPAVPVNPPVDAPTSGGAGRRDHERLQRTD